MPGDGARVDERLRRRADAIADRRDGWSARCVDARLARRACVAARSTVQWISGEIRTVASATFQSGGTGPASGARSRTRALIAGLAGGTSGSAPSAMKRITTEVCTIARTPLTERRAKTVDTLIDRRARRSTPAIDAGTRSAFAMWAVHRGGAVGVRATGRDDQRIGRLCVGGPRRIGT